MAIIKTRKGVKPKICATCGGAVIAAYVGKSVLFKEYGNTSYTRIKNKWYCPKCKKLLDTQSAKKQ